jgi:hypothetical protein
LSSSVSSLSLLPYRRSAHRPPLEPSSAAKPGHSEAWQWHAMVRT